MSSILSTLPSSAVSTKTRADGRITSTRVTFTGDNTHGFGTLRAQGKALGLKGNTLKEWIYSQASGDAAAHARLTARALFNAALDKGAVPSHADFKPNGNATFSLIPEAKEPKTRTITCVDPKALVASMTPEQRNAIFAALLEIDKQA